jgi:hypothetical protein
VPAQASSGAAPWRLRRAQRRLHQRGHAVLHLPAARREKVRQQQAVRVGAGLHQAGHARGQGHRLAGPGAGNHQQRVVAMFGGRALLVVQRGERVARRSAGGGGQHGRHPVSILDESPVGDRTAPRRRTGLLAVGLGLHYPGALRCGRPKAFSG